MRGKRMPERMRADLLFQICFICICFDDFPNRHPGEWMSPHIEENDIIRFLFSDKMRSDNSEIQIKVFKRFLSYRNNPLFGTFTEHSNYRGFLQKIVFC